MNDAILIQSAAAGDEAAAGALYRRYADLVRRVLAQTGTHEAEDLAQEVWLRVYGSLSSFRGDCAFSTWLYRVARNVAASAGRRAAVRPELVEEVPDMVGRPPSDVPLRIDLTRALAEVPPRMRRVLWLHDVEGWTHAEIGGLLGVSEGTSKSQLFKARARLRAVLAPRRGESLEAA